MKFGRCLLTGIGMFLVSVGGCSGSKAPDAPLADAAVGDGGEFISCKDDPRARQYAAGMEQMGSAQQIKVTLLSSVPGPPVKGFNVWTVKIVDAADAPLSGALMKVTPFMPDHGHGPSVKPIVTPLPEPGQYTISQINLFMAGIWQVTLNVTSATGARDAAVFSFCIDQ